MAPVLRCDAGFYSPSGLLVFLKKRCVVKTCGLLMLIERPRHVPLNSKNKGKPMFIMATKNKYQWPIKLDDRY